MEFALSGPMPDAVRRIERRGRRDRNSSRFHGGFINASLAGPILGGYENEPAEGKLMKSRITKLIMALGLAAVGIAVGAAGIHIGDTDDAPGAALIGILLAAGMVALGVRIALRKT